MKKETKVLLLCYTGASSTYFVANMKEEAEKRKADVIIESHTISPFPKNLKGYNVILVAPQVRHTIKQIKKIVEKDNIPIIPLDFQSFGLREGGKVLDQILNFKKRK